MNAPKHTFGFKAGQLTPIEEHEFSEAFNFEPQILPVAKEIYQNLAAPVIITEEEVFEAPIQQEAATSSPVKSPNVPISALRAAFFELVKKIDKSRYNKRSCPFIN